MCESSLHPDSDKRTFCGNRRKLKLSGVQDTLLQNMAPWNIEYFKLKESEKWPMMENSLASPEAGHETLIREVPSLYPEEKHP